MYIVDVFLEKGGHCGINKVFLNLDVFEIITLGPSYSNRNMP
jgi:hypothetical protein